jgi:DNA polymerase-3 subunit delta'
MADGKAPGLAVLRPRSKSRRILVDEVRDLERTLGLTSTGDSLKVALLLDVDRMNDQAQNAFLKTLEEPTDRTLLLLTSTNPRLLLPTVRSRCHVISLLGNRRSYESATRLGVFPVLAQLRFGAGAAAALAGGHALATVFAQARQHVEAAEPAVEPSLQAMLAADTNLRKHMEEERTAAREAEYLTVRQDILDAIAAWYQQWFLLAAGAVPDKLPHPEFFDACGDPSVRERRISREEAERGLRAATELTQGLAANVDERLCLESFCLIVCERPPSAAPAR